MTKEECEQNYILIWQDTTPKTVQFVETDGLKIAIFEGRIIEKNPSFSLLISVPSPFLCDNRTIERGFRTQKKTWKT